MSIDYNVLAIPKGRTVRQRRAKAKRDDAKALKAFQDAVWKRECDKLPFMSREAAKCQDCGRWVYRDTCIPSRLGHVHHVVSRRHRAKRTDPANGRLLCRECHNNIHGREF